jgi:DNA repair exonuclease SbcCD ATPase subunit
MLNRERSQCERDLVAERDALNRIAPEAEGGVAGLRQRLDSARAELDQLRRDGVNLEALPDLQAARNDLSEARTRAAAADQSATNASTALDEHHRALEQHKEQWAAPKQELRDKRGQHSAKQASLDLLPSGESLLERIAAAKKAIAEQEDAVAQLVASAGGESVELVRTRLQRLEQSLNGHRQKIADLENRKAALRTTLERNGAAGIGEQISEKERALELAVAERDQMARDTQVLGLLNSVLTSAERDAKDRFMGPITDRIRPYLVSLLPDADIELDETLGVRSVTRGAAETPNFSDLSMGTQEQINILARVAIAEMMAEQGKPAMLILDDPLSHSDDQRLERMFDILNMVANSVQVLVLSCHTSAFERAGGKLLSIKEFPNNEGVAT